MSETAVEMWRYKWGGIWARQRDVILMLWLNASNLNQGANETGQGFTALTRQISLF
jgi:hypothetical protein